MKQSLIFSTHARYRIQERLQLTCSDIVTFVEAGVYVHVARVFDSEKNIPVIYLLLWDYKASKPALVVIEERENEHVVVTAFVPTLFQNPREGVVVYSRFVESAYARARRFVRERGEYWPLKLRLYILVTSNQADAEKNRKVFMGEIQADRYHTRYHHSLGKYLNCLVEHNIRHLDGIAVPTHCRMEAVLYHYPALGCPRVFDRFFITKDTPCVEAV